MIEYSNEKFIALVKDYIHSARNREILIDRYVDGLAFKELADKYHLTERRIKEICYRDFEKLANML